MGCAPRPCRILVRAIRYRKAVRASGTDHARRQHGISMLEVPMGASRTLRSTCEQTPDRRVKSLTRVFLGPCGLLLIPLVSCGLNGPTVGNERSHCSARGMEPHICRYRVWRPDARRRARRIRVRRLAVRSSGDCRIWAPTHPPRSQALAPSRPASRCSSSATCMPITRQVWPTSSGVRLLPNVDNRWRSPGLTATATRFLLFRSFSRDCSERRARSR